MQIGFDPCSLPSHQSCPSTIPFLPSEFCSFKELDRLGGFYLCNLFYFIFAPYMFYHIVEQRWSGTRGSDVHLAAVVRIWQEKFFWDSEAVALTSATTSV